MKMWPRDGQKARTGHGLARPELKPRGESGRDGCGLRESRGGWRR